MEHGINSTTLAIFSSSSVAEQHKISRELIIRRSKLNNGERITHGGPRAEYARAHSINTAVPYGVGYERNRMNEARAK